MVSIRRVYGDSMLPTIKSGQLAISSGRLNLKVGHLIIFKHSGIDKIKRITNIKNNQIYVRGDNLFMSTDSRDFGYIDKSQVIGRVVWPINKGKLI